MDSLACRPEWEPAAGSGLWGAGREQLCWVMQLGGPLRQAGSGAGATPGHPFGGLGAWEIRELEELIRVWNERATWWVEVQTTRLRSRPRRH